jgi:murein DD-endopeptidase MepM/ murein hydrolase activator NlpD
VKKAAGIGCLGFLGLTACYILAIVIMPAYAVGETARQLPMFAAQIEAWAMGSDPGQEAVVGGSIQFALEGYAGPANFACILPPEIGVLSSPYGDTEGRTSPHRGIDYSTCWCRNYPVRTPFGGLVTFAGIHPVYGGAVVIENQGWQVLFAHLNAELVVRGQVVSAGDEIGLSGNTGEYTTGPHLHFEERECDLQQGTCVSKNPMSSTLPGQNSSCNWNGLGLKMSCSEFRADPANVCPEGQ